MAYEKFFEESKAVRVTDVQAELRRYAFESNIEPAPPRVTIDGKDLVLSPYNFNLPEANPYLSTIQFFQELAAISIALSKVPNKLEMLREALVQVNKKLPA